MKRAPMTPAEEIARTLELQAAYAAERCVFRGCTEHGPFGYHGRNYCRAHRPEARPTGASPAAPARAAILPGRLL